MARNEIAEAAAAETDLATALVKFEDAGRDLAERCNQAGFVYLCLLLRRMADLLAKNRIHEFARGPAQAAEIELGDRVKDRITGLKGIAVGETNWLYGCRRIVIQPETEKDGKPADTFCVDEPQLELLERGVIQPRQPVAAAEVPPPRRHGPRPDAARRSDPAR